jgi:lysophospholipase L1-like esterase
MNFSRITAFSVSLLLGVVSALTGVAPAQAVQASGALDYAALGDSYSSGVGAGDYDSASGACKRSDRAYPALWAARNSPSSFSFAACSGARTSDVTGGQLDTLGPSTDLVSLSVGGNDAGFAEVMTTCALQSESACLARIAQARDYVDTALPGRLDSVYAAIADRAPSARVVVLGYPRFYRLGGSCAAGLTERERAAVNAAADHLNAVTEKRAADHGYAFADVTQAFTGHEICSGVPWLHSVNLLAPGDSYHPTAQGQSDGYLSVLTSHA